VRNDAGRLRRCLASLQANRPRGAQVEIIVVDNGSIDGSPAVATAAGAIVMDCPGLRVSELRNRGAAAASGEILAFIDADHEIVPEWVEHAVVTLGSDSVAAVGAAYRAPSNGTWVQKTYDLLRRHHEEIREVEWLASGNMAVWRDSFLQVGGFDETLETCEDVDLCRRLRAQGMRVLHDPRLRSVHLGDPASLAEVFRGELWRGRDNIRASFRGFVRLRDLVSTVVPVVQLVLMALVLVGAATVSATGLWAATAGIGGFLAAASARAFRMLDQSDHVTARLCGQVLMVAVVYDLARALALVRPADHEQRRTS
jgi:glycosyltransferase involved in cell wall biosynthesis